MAYQGTEHYPAWALLPRWVVVGFLAGFVSVLVFHQGAAGLLHALGLTPRAPYSFQPTQPLGVPVLLSISFWGGVWGRAARRDVRATGRRAAPRPSAVGTAA